MTTSASKGGNFLLNVGPTSEGLIPGSSIERLKGIAAWMKVNGDAIHGTSASPFTNAPAWGRCTSRRLPDGNTRLYLHVFNWPVDATLTVKGMANDPLSASLLAKPGLPLKLAGKAGDTRITVPAQALDPIATVIMLDVQGVAKPQREPGNQTTLQKPIIAILCSAVAAASLAAGNKDYPVAPVPFTSMHVQDEFWFPRMETNRRVTMKADFKKCEETGPIVYCLEGVDNEQVFNLVLPDDAKLVANCRDDLLGGVTVIRGDVRLAVKEDGGKAITEPARMLAIPHYALCNRGPAEINVWLARTAEKAPDDK